MRSDKVFGMAKVQIRSTYTITQLPYGGPFRLLFYPTSYNSVMTKHAEVEVLSRRSYIYQDLLWVQLDYANIKGDDFSRLGGNRVDSLKRGKLSAGKQGGYIYN